jgi:hypothetical protein
MFDMLLGAGGGVFGILGALIKNGIEVFEHNTKAQANLAILAEQNKHELLMADKHAELIKLEAENALTLADVNTAKALDIASYNALADSYSADKATYSDDGKSKWLVMVDVIRGLIRPILTLVFSFSIIFFTLWVWASLAPNGLTSHLDFLESTFYRLIDALIFLTTSAVGWWFAARKLHK